MKRQPQIMKPSIATSHLTAPPPPFPGLLLFADSIDDCQCSYTWSHAVRSFVFLCPSPAPTVTNSLVMTSSPH